MKIIIYTLLAFLFLGCSKDVPGEGGIELKNHLTFEGSVTPEILRSIDKRSVSYSQTYLLKNKYCSYIDYTAVTLNIRDFNDKNLTPFGENTSLDNDFCIEQRNGKTFLYPYTKFKEKYRKEDAQLAVENLILAINKTKLGDQVGKESIEEKNTKSWN